MISSRNRFEPEARGCFRFFIFLTRGGFLSTAVASGQPFRLRDLTLSVYLPTIIFSIGQGAVIPIIPLFAIELGASPATAGLIVAMRGIGQLLFDVPAGVAVSKYGDRFAMVAGTVLVVLVAIGAALSSSILVLAGLSLLMGGGWAFWQIARLSYVTESAPLNQRGRAMSMTGGMSRVGNFIGPVMGGLLATQFGLESAFIAQAVMGSLAAVVMFAVVKKGADLAVHPEHGNVFKTLKEHRQVFLTAGPPILALSILRQARLVFLPLWGNHIGLSVAEIGIVTSASFFIDAAVFYPVGSIMDKFGRKWASVPCLLTLALGLAILPLSNSFETFVLVALVSGVGNGFGTGIVMTLGADFAPAIGRGNFLGVWRLVSDSGQAGGPVIISALTAVGSLALAAEAGAAIGFGGAAMMAFFVAETLGVREKKQAPPSEAEKVESETTAAAVAMEIEGGD